MKLVIYIIVWFVITTIWSVIKNETKSKMIGRYVFTFMFMIIIYLIIN